MGMDILENEFIKETIIIDKSETEKNRELIRSIILTKRKLNQAYQNFEFADNELIDYYTYNIKANFSKLDYLIKLAKKKGILIDPGLKDNNEIDQAG